MHHAKILNVSLLIALLLYFVSFLPNLLYAPLSIRSGHGVLVVERIVKPNGEVDNGIFGEGRYNNK